MRRCHCYNLSTIGWICWDEWVFDAERVLSWLKQLSELPGSQRTKAVLHTNEGWWGFNFVDDIKEARPSGYRRDSRLEIVIEGERLPSPEILENELRNCLVSVDSTVRQS